MSLDKAWLIIQDLLYYPVTGEKLKINERQRPNDVRAVNGGLLQILSMMLRKISNHFAMGRFVRTT